MKSKQLNIVWPKREKWVSRAIADAQLKEMRMQLGIRRYSDLKNYDDLTPEELRADGGWRVVVEALRSMPYEEYLQTNHWQDIRERTKRIQGNRCHRAGCSSHFYDVHHNCYDNLGMELLGDVEGLCRFHHHEFHQNWLLGGSLK